MEGNGSMLISPILRSSKWDKDENTKRSKVSWLCRTRRQSEALSEGQESPLNHFSCPHQREQEKPPDSTPQQCREGQRGLGPKQSKAAGYGVLGAGGSGQATGHQQWWPDESAEGKSSIRVHYINYRQWSRDREWYPHMEQDKTFCEDQMLALWPASTVLCRQGGRNRLHPP